MVVGREERGREREARAEAEERDGAARISLNPPSVWRSNDSGSFLTALPSVQLAIEEENQFHNEGASRKSLPGHVHRSRVHEISIATGGEEGYSVVK